MSLPDMQKALVLKTQEILAQFSLPLEGAMDDSRKVRPGDLFLAYPGHEGGADGRAYIAEAIAKGASAVCWEKSGGFGWKPEWEVPHLAVENLRAFSGMIAHQLAGRPSEAMPILAVTGTNGKTTVSQWLAKLWAEPCLVAGTLGAGFLDALEDTGLTTPQSSFLARFLADGRKQGARACALEASSIGIEEGRLDGLWVDTAIFTNFTHDHLDYHKTMEAYALSKEKLFLWPRLRLAVLNLDDALGQRLARSTVASKVVGYSLEGRNDVSAVFRAESLKMTATGQSFRLATPRGKADVETRLPGRYNIANLLAVAVVLQDQGMNVLDIARNLSGLTPPPGRMEYYGGECDEEGRFLNPLAIVDYAHSPDALENALSSLVPLAKSRGGRLFCVFGCGGERDKKKRPVMGVVALECADEVWVTSDNPRGEDPQSIIQDILEGAPDAKVVPDRKKAIEEVVALAQNEDVILVAGKGHENYQEIAGICHPFSDREEIQKALIKRHEAQAKGGTA